MILFFAFLRLDSMIAIAPTCLQSAPMPIQIRRATEEIRQQRKHTHQRLQYHIFPSLPINNLQRPLLPPIPPLIVESGHRIAIPIHKNRCPFPKALPLHLGCECGRFILVPALEHMFVTDLNLIPSTIFLEDRQRHASAECMEDDGADLRSRRAGGDCNVRL